MKKRFFLAVMVFALVAVLMACSKDEPDTANGDGEESASWPEKNINFIVHSGPGNVDTAVRQMGQLLEKELGVKIIIENHPGGSGAVSANLVNSKPADGYTFLTLTGSTSFSVASKQNEIINENWPMVSSFQMEPAAIAVHKDSELNSIDDFVNQMKEDPSNLVVGGYGSAGAMTYVYYELQNLAGFEGKWIPIDTTDEVATGLLGKHIDVAFMSPSSAISAIKNGDVKILAVASEERNSFYPEVPTFKEEGYDLVGSVWRGITAKEGTPKEVVEKMNATIMDIMKNSEEWKNFQEQAYQENDYVTADELSERFKQEIEDRVEFLKAMGQLE